MNRAKENRTADKRGVRTGREEEKVEGSHPGMERRAVDGLMDAGSLLVATNNTTIFLLLLLLLLFFSTSFFPFFSF